MKCKEVEKRLPAYIDVELDTATREVVKTHLKLCPACSLAYDTMKKTLEAARHWKARPLPESFVETVRERAARGDAPRPVVAGHLRQRDLSPLNQPHRLQLELIRELPAFSHSSSP